MRRVQGLAVVLALGSGLLATLGVNTWLNHQAEWAKSQVKPAEPQIALTTVVVAREDLAFGAEVARSKLQEVEWPAASVPVGAFRNITEIFTEQEARVVLEALRGNEPVLRGKISGPGQRAGMSNMLTKGMKAVSIRVNDVIGVSGFVLPGDRVDVLLTREIKEDKGKKSEGSSDQSATAAFTDILLENMRVLAIDQVADPKLAAPKLGRTVTVEATMEDAQRITLAATVGTLSLVLRESGSAETLSERRRIDVADLSGDSGDKHGAGAFLPTNAVAQPAKAVTSDVAQLVTVKVIRAAESADYSVKRTPISP